MTGKELPAYSEMDGAPPLLPTGSEAQRIATIAELAGRGDAASANQLTEMLADPRWRIRQAAAEALVQCVNRGPALQAVLDAMRRGYRDLGLLNGVLRVLGQTNLNVLPALEEFLSAADPDLRIYATQALGERGVPAAVPALLNSLRDSDPNVRSHAIESLGKLQSARATDALLEIALSRDFAVAWPALDALAAIGDARIAPQLLPLLTDDLLAEPAVQALGQLGDEEIVIPLLLALENQRAQASTVASALDALHLRYTNGYGTGDYITNLVRGLLKPATLQILLTAVRTCTPAEAPALARVLNWFDGPEVVSGLLHLLTIPQAREAAGEALVQKGEPAAMVLDSLLSVEDTGLARKAIELIGRMGSRRHVESLLSLLRENDELAPVVVGALAMIGDERAYPALRELLVHPRANVRQAAVAAINCIAHPDRATDVGSWLEDSTPLKREAGLKIACYLGSPEWMDAIVACCEDDNESVRAVAIESLVLLDDERIPEILLKALRADSPTVRAAAVRALRLGAPERSHSLLTEALTDGHVWVRYFAARALGSEMGLDERTLAALDNSLRLDEATQVRIAAIQALTPYRRLALLPLLTDYAQSPDSDLARAALKALGAMRNSEASALLVSMLNHDDLDRRLAGIAGLGESGQLSAVGPLVRAVHQQSPELGKEALVALGHCEAAEAAAALIELAALPRWRETCISVLVQMARRHCDWVAAGLDHPDLDVRRAVVKVLSEVRIPEANYAIRKVLVDISPTVRYAALKALAHAPPPD